MTILWRVLLILLAVLALAKMLGCSGADNLTQVETLGPPPHANNGKGKGPPPKNIDFDDYLPDGPYPAEP
jgi:hypothetical protein